MPKIPQEIKKNCCRLRLRRIFIFRGAVQLVILLEAKLPADRNVNEPTAQKRRTLPESRQENSDFDRPSFLRHFSPCRILYRMDLYRSQDHEYHAGIFAFDFGRPARHNALAISLSGMFYWHGGALFR